MQYRGKSTIRQSDRSGSCCVDSVACFNLKRDWFSQWDSNFDFLDLAPPVVIMLAIKVRQALRKLGGDFE